MEAALAAGSHGTCLRALQSRSQANLPANGVACMAHFPCTLARTCSDPISCRAATTASAKGSASLLRAKRSRDSQSWQGRTRSTSRDRATAVRASADSTAPAADKKLPDKKKAIYSHSLPSIEQWLTSLGFYQSKVDRAVWLVERPDWHAQLSLDLTELHIKYLKSGPGNLEKDVERKFSYALSREDLDNAILGGP